MIKIFTYVGNQRGDQSGTYQVVDKFINRLSEKMPIESVIYTSRDSNIRTCRGCTKCFSAWGECRAIDDDLNSLIEQMEKSDIIILASPVYVHNVSGDMKNFIDRLAVWTHLLKLVGKLGISITYSGSNGNEEVATYLNKILTYWGMPVIGSLNIAHLVDEDGVVASKIDDLVARTIQSTSDSKSLNFKTLEKIFELYKEHYEKIGKCSPNHPEYQYWEQKEYLAESKYETLFFKYTHLS